MKKLVGEGKPFHSAVDKAAKTLKRKVGTGAEFMKELMGVTGIKPTELQERGLTEIMGMPKMTHDQFMAALSAKPAPAIREKVFKENPSDKEWFEEVQKKAMAEYGRPYGELDHEQQRDVERYTDKDKTHHKEYTLPGGENYREMLIKLPDERSKLNEKGMELDAKLRRAAPENRSAIMRQIDELKAQKEKTPEVFGGVGSHFGGEPGILASMRLKDRIVPGDMGYTLVNKKSGNKSQHYATAEEAQAAMQNMPESMRPMLSIQQSRGPDKKLLHLEELQSDWHQQGREHGYGNQLTPEDEARIKEFESRQRHQPNPVGEPLTLADRAEWAGLIKKRENSVPDAPFKKNWEEMALKRLIHHAAEKGYHGVVVTPGKEQAERYNIGNHIDRLDFSKNSNGTVDISGIKDRNAVVDKTMQTPEQVEGLVGKELAQKIFNTTTSFGSLNGLDLQVGGEGMKAFYDKKVPNILNSIGKKYGVKTELNGHKLRDPNGRSDTAMKLGVTPQQYAGMSPQERDTFHAKLDDINAKPLHHFPITEEMRKDVLTNGLPLYNRGGKVHMAEGGDMDTMKLEMMSKRMATGGSPATKGYVTHEPKKPHPEVGTRFKATPQGNLAPLQSFDLTKHEGKGSIVPIPYDATTRDNLVTEVSGHNLINPLLTEAGFDYSLDPTHMAQNIGGASNRAIAKRVQDRVNQAATEHGENVFLAPNTMSEDAENFSHHPAHIVLDLMAQRQLKKNTLRALSDDLRGQPELKRNARTGEVTKTFPYKKFLGYDHPNMMEQVMKGGHGLESTPGDLRKKMMERLSLVNMQKLLDYNMGDLKAAILDPELATDPKAYMGRTFVKAQPNAPLRPSAHTSYDTDYTGTNVGGLGANRPLEILMPDITESIYKELKARPAKTVKTPAQMRAQVVGAIEKRKEKFAQPINARVINNAGLYEEGLRNGEFDPKNVDSVLAYFKRKGGYKKGGIIKKADGGLIDIKNVGVEEAPNMDVKAFVMPRKPMSNSFPVGGVQQPPQAPQMPQQNAQAPQAPQGMPQGAPFAPQGAPTQPPSNILQMTPQGQAMSAIRPPQMARGGKVDRDMMMLHVMNRKMKVKHG